MYALVEYVDDGEQQIVNASKIKRFDSANVVYNKKYKVQWDDGQYYEAFILIIGETEEEVGRKKETTRIKKPNPKFAESDLGTASEAESDKTKKVKDKVDDDFANKFHNKLQQMKTVPTDETNEKIPVHSDDSDPALLDQREKDVDKRKNDSENRKYPKHHNKNQPPSIVKSNVEGKANVTGEASVFSSHNRKLNEKTIADPSTGVPDAIGLKKDTAGDSSSKKKDKRSKAPSMHDQSEHSKAKEASKLDQKQTQKPKIVSDKRILDKINIVKMQSQSHSTKQDNNIKQTLASVTAENEQYRKLLKEKDAEITALKERNTSLQVRVIAEFDELRGIIRELRQVNVANIEERENNELFVVGYRRQADNTIYLGRDVWLPCNVYDSVVCISRSNAQFVKNCAIAIFGTETLMTSSVTGSVSNRTRKTKDEPARPKLDTEKLLALKDIYKYYLQHTKKLDEVTIGFELNQVGTLVSQKIYELNRSKKKTTTAMEVGARNNEDSDAENNAMEQRSPRNNDGEGEKHDGSEISDDNDE